MLPALSMLPSSSMFLPKMFPPLSIDVSQDNWKTLVPEHDHDVLEWAACVNKTKLVLCYLHDVKVRAEISLITDLINLYRNLFRMTMMIKVQVSLFWLRVPDGPVVNVLDCQFVGFKFKRSAFKCLSGQKSVLRFLFHLKSFLSYARLRKGSHLHFMASDESLLN